VVGGHLTRVRKRWIVLLALTPVVFVIVVWLLSQTLVPAK
jgi:hypothetical protein